MAGNYFLDKYGSGQPQPVLINPNPMFPGQVQGQGLENQTRTAALPKVQAESQVAAATTPDQIQQQRIKTQMDALKLFQERGKGDDSAKKVAASDEAARNLINAVARARSLTNGFSTGGAGNVANQLPWVTDASRLHSVIEQQLRGNIFRNWVDSLKAQSDNGSTGIGRVLQSEIPLVTGAQGALDQFNLDQNDMLGSYDSITNGAVRSSALTHGEDPTKPGIVDKYRQQFGLPSQLQVASSNPALTPQAANEAIHRGISAFQQSWPGQGHIPARQQAFQKFMQSAGMQGLFAAVNKGGSGGGDPELDAAMSKYGGR